MVQILGEIRSITLVESQAGVPPKLDDAAVEINVEEPYGDGTITAKLYPAATAGLVVGPCRIQVDQG